MEPQTLYDFSVSLGKTFKVFSGLSGFWALRYHMLVNSSPLGIACTKAIAARKLANQEQEQLLVTLEELQSQLTFLIKELKEAHE